MLSMTQIEITNYLGMLTAFLFIFTNLKREVMMKRISQFNIAWLFILMTLAITGCQTLPNIHVIKDESVKFTDYKTYGFHPALELRGDDYYTASTQYIKSAINTEMTQKGFRYSETPDLWLNFNVHVKDKLKVTEVYTGSRYYFYRWEYSAWDDYPLSRERISQYTQGTLNIDLIDRKTNRLVWEGIAVGKIDESTYDNLETKVNETVELIFSKFNAD